MKSREVQVKFVGAERLVKEMLHWSTKVICNIVDACKGYLDNVHETAFWSIVGYIFHHKLEQIEDS